MKKIQVPSCFKTSYSLILFHFIPKAKNIIVLIICHGQEKIYIDLFFLFLNHICERQIYLAEEVNLFLEMLLSLAIQLLAFGSQEKAAEECEFILNCIIFKIAFFVCVKDLKFVEKRE